MDNGSLHYLDDEHKVANTELNIKLHRTEKVKITKKKQKQKLNKQNSFFAQLMTSINLMKNVDVRQEWKHRECQRSTMSFDTMYYYV